MLFFMWAFIFWSLMKGIWRPKLSEILTVVLVTMLFIAVIMRSCT